jgi:hypothetical protein
MRLACVRPGRPLFWYNKFMVKQYVHQELGNEIRSVSGCYIPQKEVRMPCNGQEVLYITGRADIDTSCCANGCWSYAQVPGFIRRWQTDKSQSGAPVSEVEPIEDNTVRQEIRRIIENREVISQVEFWEN